MLMVPWKGKATYTLASGLISEWLEANCDDSEIGIEVSDNPGSYLVD